MDTDSIIRLEKSLHTFETRSNKKVRTKLLHPDFFEIGRSGKGYNLDQICQMMDQETEPDGHVHSQEYETVELTEKLCQLLYKSAWVDANGVASFHSQRSSIWMLTKVGWQLKYHHGVPCEEFELNQ